MEGNYQQHEVGADVCKSSSSETDRSEQSNDEIGTGRSYECVFCKRGFTTAQALGGHMNIHRKDRVKSSRPPPSSLLPINIATKSTADHDDNLNYPSLRSYSYPPIFQSYHHPPHYSPNIAPPHLSYQAAFFPASPGLYVDDHSQHDLNSYPFGVGDGEDDCSWGRSTLSLRIGSSHVDDDHSKRISSTDHGSSSSQDDELDLELRLGHHHVHP